MSEESLRAEIVALRSDLTGALTAGLTALNLTMAQLTEQHHQAMLEQAKANASFATRERVESVARHAHDQANAITVLTARMAANEQATAELRAAMNAGLKEITTTLAGLSGQLTQLGGHSLDSDQFEWVKQGQVRTRTTRETRAQLAKQLAGYLMVAVAGIIISGLGVTHLLTALFGGH